MTSSPRLCAGCVSGGIFPSRCQVTAKRSLSFTALHFCLPPAPLNILFSLKNSFMFLYKGIYSVSRSVTLGCSLTLCSVLTLKAVQFFLTTYLPLAPGKGGLQACQPSSPPAQLPLSKGHRFTLIKRVRDCHLLSGADPHNRAEGISNTLSES